MMSIDGTSLDRLLGEPLFVRDKTWDTPRTAYDTGYLEKGNHIALDSTFHVVPVCSTMPAANNLLGSGFHSSLLTASYRRILVETFAVPDGSALEDRYVILSSNANNLPVHGATGPFVDLRQVPPQGRRRTELVLTDPVVK